MTVYRMLIRSKIDYGYAVFASASDQVANRLNSIHHTAIRLATGAFRTSPVDSLLAESSEWSLKLRRNYLTVNAYIHTATTPNLHLSSSIGYQVEGLHSDKFLRHRAVHFTHSLNIQMPRLTTATLPPVPPWSTFMPPIDLSMNRFSKSTPEAVIQGAY